MDVHEALLGEVRSNFQVILSGCPEERHAVVVHEALLEEVQSNFQVILLATITS